MRKSVFDADARVETLREVLRGVVGGAPPSTYRALHMCVPVTRSGEARFLGSRPAAVTPPARGREKVSPKLLRVIAARKADPLPPEIPRRGDRARIGESRG